jgi:serine/threonine protein kinase
MRKLGPNLKTLVRKQKQKRFSLQTVVQVGLQLIERLEALHKNFYLHLDLKPDNILIGSHNFAST